MFYIRDGKRRRYVMLCIEYDEMMLWFLNLKNRVLGIFVNTNI